MNNSPRPTLVDTPYDTPNEATPLHVDVVHDLGQLRHSWPSIVADDDNIFATWEWTSLWCRHFAQSYPLRLVTVRERADNVVGVLPLYLTRRGPLRIAWSVGHTHADLIGPACRRSRRTNVLTALAESLYEHADWHALVAHGVPSSECWERALRGAVIEQWGFPLIRIDGTWDDYVRGRSRHMRRQVRGRLRRLERDHRVSFRMCDDPSRLDDDFDVFVRLHRARWSSEGVFHPADDAFHRAFARVAQRRGWLRLWFLELDGNAVAAALVYRYAGVDILYQVGRNPAWNDYAVGFVLLCRVARDAFDAHVREFRFLRGNEHYKYRFATDDPGVATIVVPSTRSARAVFGAARLASSAIGRPRAILTRIEQHP